MMALHISFHNAIPVSLDEISSVLSRIGLRGCGNSWFDFGHFRPQWAKVETLNIVLE